MHSRVCAVLLLLAALTAGERPLAAQYGGAAVAGGPQFFIAGTGDARPVATDPSRVSALRARISLELENVMLETALDAISAQSGMRIAYSRALVPLGTRVSLSASDISIAAALTEVLLDTGVDVLISRTGQLTLTPREADPAQLEPGTIVGHVTDAETGAPIAGAQILVDGSGRAVTGEDGRYRINGVTPGRRTVSVTHVGYARVAQETDVGDGATVTVDFSLEVSPSQLDEVVVTVTGEQRVRELGHVVARINVDSLVKEAPVSTISELLTGRIPGVHVFQSQGIVGGDVQLQVRTPNSLVLGTQPIVIVDGVRYTNTAALDPARNSRTIYGPGSLPHTTQAAQAEATNPLNDLNPNDIETIEVVKGPSAATLYGTDASNGVIVVTTKRGGQGPARWNAYIRPGISDIPLNSTNRAPDRFWGWGTRPDGTPYSLNCTLDAVASSVCTQDSVTVIPNPVADPSQTIYESKPAWDYGMNVSGGSQDLQYYVAGNFSRATGALRMPPALRDSIEAARGSRMPEDQLTPNVSSNLNVRSNLTAMLGEAIELRGNLGYVRRSTRTIASGGPYSADGIFTPTNPWGTASGGDGGPENFFSRTSTEQVDRFLFGASAQVRPIHWLQARAAVGVDLSNGVRNSLERRGETVTTFDGSSFVNTGEVGNNRTQQRTTTADLGLTASLRRGRLSSRTSVGAQYVRSLNEVQMAWGKDLIPGGESLSQANNRFADHVYSETLTLGSYVEQTVGLNDRLFLTGALRADGASAFGHDYQAAVYPKAGISWIVSEEPFLPRIPGLDELRLRYAFGASGQQAYPWMALPSFQDLPGQVEGTDGIVINIDGLGNENLRPERVREHEFGFDATALGNRIQTSLAWYRRRSVDQIERLTLAPGLGEIYTNLGLTTASGFEASLRIKVLETQHLSWDVHLNHSSHSTLLLDIGDGVEVPSRLGGFKEGYPLGGVFAPPYLGYTDEDNDGIVWWNDLQWGDTAVYLGQSTAPRRQQLTTVIGLFDQRLRISALFDRSTGGVQNLPNWCNGSVCREAVDPSTPVDQQAAAAVVASNRNFVSADFTRLREVTVAVNLPLPGTLAALGLRSGRLSVSARNLALWTSFRGGDPESVRVSGFQTSVGGTLIPQARSLAIRFDIGH